MLQKTKMAIIAAVAASSFAAPAFAPFARGWGTGNEQPAYYDSEGSLHVGFPPTHGQAAVARNGLYAYAKTTRNRSH
jgi:hypothetical protein